jgi:hypothetical protein
VQTPIVARAPLLLEALITVSPIFQSNQMIIKVSVNHQLISEPIGILYLAQKCTKNAVKQVQIERDGN